MLEQNTGAGGTAGELRFEISGGGFCDVLLEDAALNAQESDQVLPILETFGDQVRQAARRVRQGLLEFVIQVIEPVLEFLAQKCQQQFFFALEVQVGCAFGEFRLGGNLVHGDARERALCPEGAGGFQKVFAALEFGLVVAGAALGWLVQFLRIYLTDHESDNR